MATTSPALTGAQETGKRKDKRSMRARAGTPEQKHARDAEIAAGLAQGKPLKTIARELNVHQSAVEHRSNQPEVKSLLVVFLERATP